MDRKTHGGTVLSINKIQTNKCGGIKEFLNSLLATTTVMIITEMNYQWILKLLGEKVLT